MKFERSSFLQNDLSKESLVRADSTSTSFGYQGPGSNFPKIAQVPRSRGPKVVITGAPGADGSWQSQRASRDFGAVVVDPLLLLRDALVHQDDEYGRWAKMSMESGLLIPDELIVGLVARRLGQADCIAKGWVLDGFPKTASQAHALKKYNIKPDHFILMAEREKSDDGIKPKPKTRSQRKFNLQTEAYESALRGLKDVYTDITDKVIAVEGLPEVTYGQIYRILEHYKYLSPTYGDQTLDVPSPATDLIMEEEGERKPTQMPLTYLDTLGETLAQDYLSLLNQQGVQKSKVATDSKYLQRISSPDLFASFKSSMGYQRYLEEFSDQPSIKKSSESKNRPYLESVSQGLLPEEPVPEDSPEDEYQSETTVAETEEDYKNVQLQGRSIQEWLECRENGEEIPKGVQSALSILLPILLPDSFEAEEAQETGSSIDGAAKGVQVAAATSATEAVEAEDSSVNPWQSVFPALLKSEPDPAKGKQSVEELVNEASTQGTAGYLDGIGRFNAGGHSVASSGAEIWNESDIAKGNNKVESPGTEASIMGTAGYLEGIGSFNIRDQSVVSSGGNAVMEPDTANGANKVEGPGAEGTAQYFEGIGSFSTQVQSMVSSDGNAVMESDAPKDAPSFQSPSLEASSVGTTGYLEGIGSFNAPVQSIVSSGAEGLADGDLPVALEDDTGTRDTQVQEEVAPEAQLRKPDPWQSVFPGITRKDEDSSLGLKDDIDTQDMQVQDDIALEAKLRQPDPWESVFPGITKKDEVSAMALEDDIGTQDMQVQEDVAPEAKLRKPDPWHSVFSGITRKDGDSSFALEDDKGTQDMQVQEDNAPEAKGRQPDPWQSVFPGITRKDEDSSLALEDDTGTQDMQVQEENAPEARGRQPDPWQSVFPGITNKDETPLALGGGIATQDMQVQEDVAPEAKLRQPDPWQSVFPGITRKDEGSPTALDDDAGSDPTLSGQ